MKYWTGAKQAALEPQEYELMSQLAAFAAKQLKGKEAIFQNAMYSKSLSCPVLLVVALGEQALALQALLNKAIVPEPGQIDIIGSGGIAH